MGVGLSGMISGLDTDAIVKAMVSGQQAKATKVENKITLNKWTKEAWSGLNTKIYSFYTKYASKLRLQTSYMTRTASSSNESVAKATAGSGAAVGTHSLQVKKLASSQYVTGAQLTDENGKKANYNKNTKLVDSLGVDKGTIITITGQKGTKDEEVVKLEVNETTTINDFINACKDAGLTASFDTNQQRFFISSSESGSENAFSITTNKLNADAISALDGLEREQIDADGKVIKLIDTSILTADEKKNYEEAMATIRKNLDKVSTVLSKDATTLDKTEQEIMDAINIVKDTAKKTYAKQEAIDNENTLIDTLVIESKLGSVDKIEGKYGDLYTYKALEEKAVENIVSELKKAYATEQAKSVAGDILTNSSQEWENFLNSIENDGEYLSTLSGLSPELVAEAKATKEEIEKELGKTISKVSDIANSGLSDEKKSALENAIKTINTWSAKITKANNDGSSKQITVSGLYQEQYDATYKTEYEAYTPTLENNNYTKTDVLEEMKSILKATDVYKSNVAKSKEEILTSKDTGIISDLTDKAEQVTIFLNLASYEESNEEEYIHKKQDKLLEEQDNLLKEQKDMLNKLEELVDNPSYRKIATTLQDSLKYKEAIEELKDNPDMVSKVWDVLNNGSTGLGDGEDDNDVEIICDALKGVLNTAGLTELNNGVKEINLGIERIDEIEEEVEELEQISVGLKQSAISCMGLGNIGTDENPDSQVSDGTGMVVVGASDAVFVLDGAEMIETSNSFTVNGLTLNLSATTEREDSTEDNKKYDTIQITVGKDVDSTYKLVKEAITEYNKLLEEMNTAYNADSARGYEPLTDEQKEAMSETDIENWEKKIKDSLLRRDDTLGTLLSSMRNALSTSYKDEDGKTYSLSTYGIVTGNYTEKGKLHIYGDEDDGTYATYDDRLKAALDEDPDKVMETLTHIFGNLYSTMTEKCAKTEISSALTFYNDKQYNNLLKDYEDDLDILEDRIKELEDRYYKQFTAMEKAMSTLQNQSNSLASLLGTGQ